MVVYRIAGRYIAAQKNPRGSGGFVANGHTHAEAIVNLLAKIKHHANV